MSWDGRKIVCKLTLTFLQDLCSSVQSSSAIFWSGESKISFTNVVQMFISPEGVYAVVVPCCCVILACNARQPIKKLVHVKLSFPGMAAD